MMARKKDIFFIVAIVLITSLIVWFPFAINNQTFQLFANYDGPNYLVISKCWYSPSCIARNFSLSLPLEYYPAHFPGYPATISLFDFILPGWWAMIFSTLIGTVFYAVSLYLLFDLLKIKQKVYLTVLALFLPARFLILRNIGAPEPWFLFSIVSSIYFYKKEKYFYSALFLAFAQIIKTPAILLLAAYGLDYLIKYRKNLKKNISKYLVFVLVPLSIIGVFTLYYFQTGNFLAYFQSGDNFHLVFPPFQVFDSTRSWLGDIWMEDIIFIYLLGGSALIKLYEKYKTDIMFLFPLIFFLAIIFVAHRDISRYSAPIYPFAIIAFNNFLRKKEFKILFLILLPAIYLYSINFISQNTAPVADWTPYN